MWQKVEKYYYDETDLKSALTRGVLKKGDLPASNVQTIIVYKEKSEDVNLQISRMNPIILWGNMNKDGGKMKDGTNPTYNYTYLAQGMPYGGYPQQQYYPNMAPYGRISVDSGAQYPYQGYQGQLPYNGTGQPPQTATPEGIAQINQPSKKNLIRHSSVRRESRPIQGQPSAVNRSR